MLLELLTIDKPCAEVVIKAWKEMVATTASRDKTCIFENIDDYVTYRIIDTGAPFVDTVMRFGMGILLTKEEEELVTPIVKPCFAALGLANDYYSFDIEWKEFQKPGKTEDSPTMTNAVWLYMNWDHLFVDEAKERVRHVVRGYEKDFQQRTDQYVADSKRYSLKLHKYLEALAFQIPGNIVWSLRCPRYHPEPCSEGATLLYRDVDDKKHEDVKPTIASPEILTRDSDSESSTSRRSLSAGTPRSNLSSRSSVGSLDAVTNDFDAKDPVQLGTEIRD